MIPALRLTPVKAKHNGRRIHCDHAAGHRKLLYIGALHGHIIASGRHIISHALDALQCRPTPSRSARTQPAMDILAGRQGGIGMGARGRGGAPPGTEHAVEGRGATELENPGSVRRRALGVDGHARQGEPRGGENGAGLGEGRARNRASAGRPGRKMRQGGEAAAGWRTRAGAAGSQPARSPRSLAAHPNGPKSRAEGEANDCGAVGKPPGRAVPGRSYLRLVVLKALAAGVVGGLQEIAAGIAITHLGMDAATLDAYLPGGRRRELDRNVELAAGDMEHAGLVRRGAGGRMRITASGGALLGKMGEMAGEAGSAGAQAAGGWEAEPAISDRLLRQLSPAYREWQDGGQAGRTPRRGTGKAAKVSTGIMASIDVLGAANERTDHEEMEFHGGWASLVAFARHLLRPRDGFDVRTESDTIKVIGSGHDAGTLLKLFGMSSWRIIVKGIESDMPVRGCVAAGKYWTGNEDLVTGGAVREARVWYEYADWIGIMAAPSAGAELDRLERADRGGLDSMREYYTKYNVPSKAGKTSAWAVNWPRQCEATSEDRMVGVNRIIGANLKKPLGQSAGRKWRNTKEFCDVTRRSWVPYR